MQAPDVKATLAELGAYAAHLASAPWVLVILSPLDGGIDTEFDMGRIAQSITLGCSARGLGSCIVSLYPEQNARTAAEVVGAGAQSLARHAIAIGYPAPRPTGTLAVPTGRLEVDELLSVRGS